MKIKKTGFDATGGVVDGDPHGGHLFSRFRQGNSRVTKLVVLGLSYDQATELVFYANDKFTNKQDPGSATRGEKICVAVGGPEEVQQQVEPAPKKAAIEEPELPEDGQPADSAVDFSAEALDRCEALEDVVTILQKQGRRTYSSLLDAIYALQEEGNAFLNSLPMVDEDLKILCLSLGIDIDA